MDQDLFSLYAITEPFFDVPSAVELADPAARMAEDIRIKKRLREQLGQARAESRASMRAFLRRVIEIGDALERILAREPDPNNEREAQQWNSIRLTRRMVDKALRSQGAMPLELVGQIADETLCEISDAEPRSDVPNGTVIREIVTGYRWGDDPELLRLAVVVIAQSPKESPVAPSDQAEH